MFDIVHDVVQVIFDLTPSMWRPKETGMISDLFQSANIHARHVREVSKADIEGQTGHCAGVQLRNGYRAVEQANSNNS